MSTAGSHARAGGSEDLRLLALLARLPFLRQQDLACELRAARTTVGSRLQRLQRQGYLDHLRRPTARGKWCRLYYLREAGCALVAEHEPDLLQTAWGTRERRLLALLPRLDRLLLLQDIVYGLLRAAPSALSRAGHRPHLRWSWIRDEQEALANPSRLLFADALLLLRIQYRGEAEQCYPLYLVLDHACLPQRRMHQVLAAFLHARRQVPQAQAFPPIAIILSGWQRARHWQRLAADLAAQTGQEPLRGCLAVPDWQDTPEEPGSSPWRWNWRALDTSPTHLREHLVARPAEAAEPGVWRDPSHHGRPLRDGGRSTSEPALHGRYAARATRAPAQLHDTETGRGLRGLALRPAHYRLLELLLEAPLLAEEDMAALVGQADRSIRHSLHALGRLQCIQAEQLGERRRWVVSAVGLRLLALRHHLPVRTLATSRPAGPGNEEDDDAREQRGLEGLRREAARTAGVYGFLAGLAGHARQHAGHRLAWWETAFLREYTYYSLSRQAWRFERPDAIAEYRVGTRPIRFWLEWLSAQPSKRDLEGKVAGYRDYLWSRAWTREGQVQPLLLLVCPDGAWEGQVRQSLTDAHRGLPTTALVLTTTREVLAQQGPGGAIWRLLWQRGRPAMTPGDGRRRVLYQLHLLDPESGAEKEEIS